MADEKSGTVTLIAPNGQTVSVAESKKADRLAAGYRLPRKRAASHQAALVGEPTASSGD